TNAHYRITALLADLFRLDVADAMILPYLLQGRLGPPYAAPETGLDERRLAQAVAKAAGVGLEEIWRLYQQQGDLGTVAEAVMPVLESLLSVQDVFDRFLEIARVAGPGAYERKITLFENLLVKVGNLEARYLVRIVAGRLRLGIGDATIVDALSIARVGDTSLGPAIERAYSFCSDLGLVAHTLLAQGPAALAEIHPVPGRPVLPALAARLPSATTIVAKLGRVIVEPKYDGVRLQAHKAGERVWLFTRRLEDVSHAFPEVVAAIQGQLRAREAILDGEVVGYDPRTGQLLPFQQTARRRRKHGVAEVAGQFPVRYFLFDVLSLDGVDLTSRPQAERSRQLRQVIVEEPSGVIALTPQLETDQADVLQRFFEEMLRCGLEGVVVKRPDAHYHAGARQYNWVKLKPGSEAAVADTFDLVIVGYERGRGKRAAFGIGSLLCAVYDPDHDRYRTVSRVGSGLPDAEWLTLHQLLDEASTATKPKQVDAAFAPDVWVTPRYLVEVIAGGIMRSPLHTCGKEGREPGYALRFPRIRRLRFDRRPEDATTEAEVVGLYHREETVPRA
ncbi:MAG TPA: ATP-dependent DNA ligase, partial [Chloroflexota bacterium]|nr:ATP-dependent DNA ligase [Chloroflexota bacterium]